eukprot:sb/3472491/
MEKVQLDLKSQSLYFKTNSTKKSDDNVVVAVYNATEEESIGSIWITFHSSGELFFVEHCMPAFNKITEMPSEVQLKTWIMSLSDTALTLVCNGETVLEYEFVNGVDEGCGTVWGDNVEIGWIEFQNTIATSYCFEECSGPGKLYYSNRNWTDPSFHKAISHIQPT